MSEGNLKQILTLGNSIIGVSILAMPYCLKQCGLVLGIILLIISGYINRINCHFLIKSAISTKRRSYEFLAFHIFGPMGKFAIEVIQIGFLFGICVSFFVIAGDLGPKILAQVLDIQYTDRFRAFFLSGMCFFIVLPLSLLRNTDSLASISAVSITFYVLLVLKIVSDSWRHILSGSWQSEVELWRPAGVLQALPIMSLALACQTNVFSIYENLPDPSLSRMNTVVAGAINLCTSVYILVGFFGYVAFHDVPFGGNILVHLVSSPVTRWINIGFVMSVALGFPLVVYPCRVSVNSLLFRRPGSGLELPQNHIPELRFKCITFCILVAAMSIGIVIPSIEVVLGLLGSTMGTAIAILFPSVMFIKNTSRSNLEKMAAQMSFILGIVLLVCGTYMNLYAVDKLAQEPVPAPLPAVTAPPAALSSPAAAAAAGLANATDKKDLVPDKPPGDTGRQEEAKSKKSAPEEEARKEPAVPEPPLDDKKPDVAGKVAADAKTGDEDNAAAKKRKTNVQKTDDGGDQAGGEVGAGKSKSGDGKSKHRDSKDAGAEAEAVAGKGAGDTEKRAADNGAGEGLDVGALRKEEEERQRDDALRPEDPQAKQLELKQEAVLQKLEETHKEQKELLQEQKALLKEMKQQRSDQELKKAQPEPAGVALQQQQSVVAGQSPGVVQQPAAQPQAAQQPIAQQQPVVQQPIAQQQTVVQPNAQQQLVVQPIAQLQPVVQQPIAQQQPVVQQPIAQQQPVVQQPIAQQQPVVQQPIAQQQPVVQQPIAQQQPVVQQPIAQQQPVVQQPIAQQQPVVQQPIAQQQPVVQQPVAQQQPVVQQPIAQQQPLVQQPVAQQQPALQQPIAQQPIAQAQPVVQSIGQQQPVLQQPIAQQQPVVQQPAQQQQFVVNQQPLQQQFITNQQGQQQQFVPNQQQQQQVNQQVQPQQAAQQPVLNQFGVPVANQAAPALNQPAAAVNQPSPHQPVLSAAGGGVSRRAPAQQQTAAADTLHRKHRKHAAHNRVRREATDDEMLVRLAENWAAMEAAGARASA